MPYKDKEKEKAKKRRWYAKKLADAAFAKAEAERNKEYRQTPRAIELRRLAFRRRKYASRPHLSYTNYNLDDEEQAKAYLALTNALKAIGAKFRDRAWAKMPHMVTVTVPKRTLAKLAEKAST